jgi:glycosyltransferase involved in cell wall biosynthesis
MPMRILMLDNEFPPLGGGTGVVNYHLLQEFARYPELRVDLVTSSRSRSDYPVERFAERIAIYSVPVDNRNIHHSTNPELLRYAWRGWRLARRLARQRPYDLSFAFAGVPAGVMSWALRREFGLPYLVSLQGPDVPGFEARYNSIYPFLRPVLRVVWRQAGAVTAISEQHRALAQRLTPELPIPVIANGVETDVFFPGGHGGPEIRLICVGRLIERKGQQHLLRAFAQLAPAYPRGAVRLVLVGTGDAEQPLRQQAADQGVADLVTFSGFVPREQMPEVYRQADLFVLPSQSEGMSIALLEAMAAGLAVVVTDTGGTDELVGHGDNGLVVDWADPDQLRNALRLLIDQGELRRRMGRRSRERAQAFAWPEIARQHLDLCARIAGLPAPAAEGDVWAPRASSM